MNPPENTNEQEWFVSAYLDLATQPAGAYYFNADNSLEYTKNSFNYRKYHQYDSHSVIQEVMAGSTYPRLGADELDTTKQYSLPSTSMNVSWAALGETERDTIIIDQANAQYQLGLDANENAYVAIDYRYNAYRVYNANNTLAFSKPAYSSSMSIGLAKYNSSGVAQWASRIRSNAADDDIWLGSMTTDLDGNTYIFGQNTFLFGSGSNTTIFENAAGVNTIQLNFPGPHAFLVQYNTSGTPVWVSVIGLTTLALNTVLYYDSSSTPNNLYVCGFQRSDMRFYLGSPSAPVLVQTLPYNASEGNSSNFLLKFRASSGIFEWATRFTGNTVNEWGKNHENNYRQLITTDSNGDVYVTGMYQQFLAIYNAPGTDASTIELPPPADFPVYTPVDTNRNWSAIRVDNTGANMIACVAGENVYISQNYGKTWEPSLTAGERNWSTVFCNSTFSYLVAAEYGGFVYYSTDQGNSWTIASGLGSTARNWVKIVGKPTSSALVAITQNDNLYYSLDGITWNPSSGAPIADWADVTWGIAGVCVALIRNGKGYISSNNGVSWTLIGACPTANWSGIVSLDFSTSNTRGFYATVQNGPIYRANASLTTWSIVGPVQNWSGISASVNFSMILATVYDGPIYQSGDYADTYWVPTSIPRLWKGISVAFEGQISAVIVEGGQIYIRIRDYQTTGIEALLARQTLSTFLLKYSPEGKAQWCTYMDCGITESGLGSGDGWNTCTAIATSTEGNLILTGKSSDNLLMYSRYDFVNPVKEIPKTSAEMTTFTYLVSYSADGVPLWGTRVQPATSTFSYWFEHPTSLCIGSDNRIYLTTSFGEGDTTPYGLDLEFYNSNGIRSCPYALRLPVFTPASGPVAPVISRVSALLAKYYAEGTLESVAMVSTLVTKSTAVRVHPTTNNVFLTVDTPGITDIVSTPLYVYNSPATMIDPILPQPAPSLTKNRVTNFLTPYLLVKFTQSNASSFVVQEPAYNTLFQPQFSIGGGARRLIGIYPKDYPIELWGGPTGFTPGVLQLADLNTAVVCYPGHDPGYTRELVYGLPGTSAQNTRWLAVQIDEPSFPANDPQPITPGTVPYGFLLFYAQFPAYTTSAVFNNARNDQTDLTLSALGSIVDNQSISGVYVGDVVRILGISGGNNQYLTLTVKALVSSTFALEWMGLSNPSWCRRLVSNVNGGALAAIVSSGASYVIQTSTTSGDTWVTRTGAGTRNWTALASSSSGLVLYAAASGGSVYRSVNGGLNWSPKLTTPLAWTHLACNYNGTVVYAVANGGQIYVSTDTGNTWTPKATSANWSGVCCNSNGTIAYGCRQGEYIYVSNDSGSTWAARTVAGSRNWSSIVCDDTGSIIVASVSGGYVYVSTDAGITWTPRLTDANRAWTQVSMDAYGSNLVAAATGSQLYVSNDTGTNWTPTESVRNWNTACINAIGSRVYASANATPFYRADWIEIPASIVFEQLTSTACFYWSSTETFQAQLITYNGTRLVPMYYQPEVIRQGVLQVVVHATSKEFIAPGYPVD
jgi:hypothetical protein